MADKAKAAKTLERLYSRNEVRRLTAAIANKELEVMQALGVTRARQVGTGYWIYSRADVQAIRDHRREHGKHVPDVDGFK